MAVGAILPVGESCPAGEDFLAPCRRYASRLRPRPLPRGLACSKAPPLSHPRALRTAQRRDPTADLDARRARTRRACRKAPALERPQPLGPEPPRHGGEEPLKLAREPRVRAQRRPGLGPARRATGRTSAPPRAPIAASAAWDNLGIPVCAADPATWGAGGTAPLLIDPCRSGSTHALVLAGSGGFKTTSVGVPTLLAWTGSAVVLDPAREIGPMVSACRAGKLGQRIVTLDPAAEAPARGGFNALDWIDPAGPLAETNVEAVAAWLAASPPGAWRADRAAPSASATWDAA